MTADTIEAIAEEIENQTFAALDTELDVSFDDRARAATSAAEAIRRALAHHLTGWGAIRMAEHCGAVLALRGTESWRGTCPITANEARVIAAENPELVYIPRMP